MVATKKKKATKQQSSKKVVAKKKKTTTRKTTKKAPNNIRSSRKWIELERTFKDEQHNFSTKEKYYKYIDSLMEINIDQNNLLSSFNKFVASKKG